MGRARRVGLLLLAAMVAGACAADRPARRPQLVVMVLVDALRADHLGAYGSSRGLTPNVDRFARRSFVFEHAVAASAWTRSSVASLFTSRYPSSHGVLGRTDGLPPEALTLAEVLAGRGWETLGITTNGNAGQPFGFTQGFQSFVYPASGRPGKLRAEAVTELALQCVAQRQDRLARQPLFLYLHYLDPHDPYRPHPELTGEPEPPGRYDGERPSLEALDALPPGARTADDEARIRHLYAGEVRYCDLWLGRLFDGLQRLGALDDALVVLTADHGEGLWDHGERSHGGSLYQEQLHVPLVVHYPGQQARHARRVAEPVSNVDVAPTVLAAAGLEMPAVFQGRDLDVLTRGRTRPGGLEGVYSELALDHRTSQALRLGHMKLIRRVSVADGTHTLELFDLRKDPRERDDLARRRPAATAHLASVLERWGDATRASGGNALRVTTEDLPESAREELRALGYIQ